MDDENLDQVVYKFNDLLSKMLKLGLERSVTETEGYVPEWIAFEVEVTFFHYQSS